jgi:hypothetical protein
MGRVRVIYQLQRSDEMTTTKVCDVCLDATKQPVFAVRVGIEVLGAVEGSVSTGCSHELEACEGCWPKAMGDLSANVLTQLTRDIPIHRQVAVVNGKISELYGELRIAVAARDELNPTAPAFKTAQVKVSDLLVAIELKEQERSELLESAS